MAEFLLELLSEEIPARMQARAADDLKQLVCKGFEEEGLSFQSARAFVTSRRLAVVIDGLPVSRPETREERRGPRVGSPGQAIQGFLKAAGLPSLEAAEKRTTDKGEFWFADIVKKGGPTVTVISKVINAAMRSVPWPKSMRWGSGTFTWVRPIQAAVVLFDRQVVPGEIPLGGDMPSIKFGDYTKGHRFESNTPIMVRDFADYVHQLATSYVILDTSIRKDRIVEKAQSLCRGAGVVFQDDQALLDEVAGLVEWPVPLLGYIDNQFMSLPEEVLIVSMRRHQRYFATRNHDRSLSTAFIAVANLDAADGGRTIVAGNERVLRARLSDAKFFWDQDRKIPLSTRASSLKDVIFHAKLGTQAERVDRIVKLAVELSKAVPNANVSEVETAARLCKADLVSEMVGEFPELQGTMGRYYALNDGLSPSIANAIGDHYSPLGPQDRCPTEPAAVAVALADKFDTVVSFWTMGEKPTGSRDPFALRRAALGIIRIIEATGLRIRLHQPIISAYFNLPQRAYDDQYKFELYKRVVEIFDKEQKKKSLTKAERDETTKDAFYSVMRPVVEELLAFFMERLKVQVRERGVRHDVIDAVFALTREDDLVRLLARVDALQSFLDTAAGKNLLAGYRRASNIIRAEQRKDKNLTSTVTGYVSRKLLEQEEERAIVAQLERLASKYQGNNEDFGGALKDLAALRPFIDAFFEKVTVNVTNNDELRLNRLRLLYQLRTTMDSVADFSRIEG